MDSQVHQQTWRADMRAVLRQLRQGPPLKDAQLQNLHITFRPPSPIPASQLVREHLPAYLETEDGQNFAWNLDYKRKSVILDPEDWPPSLCTQGTSFHISRCVDDLGERIENYDYDTKPLESHLTTSQSSTDYVYRNCFLIIPLAISKHKPNSKPKCVRYLTRMIVTHGRDGYRSCIMTQHYRPEQTQLSAAEVFCLFALARESQLENPAMLFYSVEVFAVYDKQFRRLRARIPSTYLDSVLASVQHASDKLADGFIVEQSAYIDTLSEDCIVSTMDAIFEPFPSTEDIRVEAEPNRSSEFLAMHRS